jgi:exosortase/archaeosortase
MSTNKYKLIDYRIKGESNLFTLLDENYSEEKWLLVQMQIDANAKERERQQLKADRDFKIVLMFLSCLGLVSISLFIGIMASSYVAVSRVQQSMEQVK